MGLSRTRQCRVWALLDGAFELPPEARQGYLQDHCADDQELLQLALDALRDEDDGQGSQDSVGLVPTSQHHDEIERSAFGQALLGGIVEDRYRILSEVSRGGTGTVFRAEHVELGHVVAIKVLHTTKDRELVVEEGRRIADLHHSNVVRVIDVGLHGQLPYLVMEWLEGCDLRQWMQAYYATPNQEEAQLDALAAHCLGGSQAATESPDWLTGSYWRFVARSLRDTARAVDFAHGLSMVHQDISPKNIFVTVEGRTALIDFGLATLLRHDPAGSGPLQRLGGTLPYMAPEHRSDREGRRLEANDVYGLGATLLHLVTGVSPERIPLPKRGFRRADVYFGGVVRKDRQVPLDLLRIAWKAMQSDPDERYPSARAFAEDLDHFLSYRPISVGRQRLTTSLRLWSKRHPVWKATVVTPIAVLGLVGGTRQVQAGLQQRRENQFAQTYLQLPAMYTLTHSWRDEGGIQVASEAVGLAMERLLELDPDQVSLRVRRLLHASRRGNLQAVQRQLQALRQSQPESLLLEQLAPQLLSEDPAQRAKLPRPVDPLVESSPPPDQGQQLQPAKTYLDILLAAYLSNYFMKDKATMEYVDQALAKNPDDWITAELGACAAAFDRDSTPRALDFLSSADDGLEPLDSCTELHIRAKLYKGEDREYAPGLWSKALRQCPDQYVVLHNLLDHDVKARSLEEAIRVFPRVKDAFSRAVAMREGVPNLYFIMVKAYRNTGNFEAAAAVLSEAMERIPALQGSLEKAKRMRFLAADHRIHLERHRLLPGVSRPMGQAELTKAVQFWAKEAQHSLTDLSTEYGSPESNTDYRITYRHAARSQHVLLQWHAGALTTLEADEELARIARDFAAHSRSPSPLVSEARFCVLYGQDLTPTQRADLDTCRSSADSLLPVRLRLEQRTR